MPAFHRLSVLTVLFVLGAFLANATPLQAQRPSFGNDSGLRLLGNQKVQEELELVEDQVEQIDEMQSAQREEMREMFMGMRDRFRDLDRESRREAMNEVRKELGNLNKKYVGRVNEILLPHQATRWEQLTFQNQAQQAGGTGSFLGSDAIKEKLSITEEQMEAMKAKADEVRKSVQEKITKIRSEAQQELLSVLTPEQQQQYKSLAGDSFAFDQGQKQTRSWDRWRGGRGDRGSRGDRGPRGDRGDRKGPNAGSAEKAAE